MRLKPPVTHAKADLVARRDRVQNFGDVSELQQLKGYINRCRRPFSFHHLKPRPNTINLLCVFSNMPLILHNVPDEELYVGEDGVQRPYAMLYPRYVPPFTNAAQWQTNIQT